MHAPDKTVTVTGQCCPLPLIELAKAMKEMQSGQVLQITGDDPIFEIGVRDYCEANSKIMFDFFGFFGHRWRHQWVCGISFA